MSELAKRLVEVEKILSYLPYEDLLKIPEEVWKAFEKEKDKTYKWEYDELVPLKNQDLPKDTILMLSYINIKYLLNEEELKFVQELLEFNEKQKIQEQQGEKTIIDTGISDINDEKKMEKEEIIEYKPSFWDKIINKIKSWFCKKD